MAETFVCFRTKKMPVSIDIACRTLAYYDVANLAQKIKVPGFYSYGYNAQKEMCRTALAAGEKLYKEYLHRK